MARMLIEHSAACWPWVRLGPSRRRPYAGGAQHHEPYLDGDGRHERRQSRALEKRLGGSGILWA